MSPGAETAMRASVTGAAGADGRSRRGIGQRGRRLRGGGRRIFEPLEFDEAHRLRLAVLGDDEIARGQSFDRFAILVLDADRLNDQLRAAPKCRLLTPRAATSTTKRRRRARRRGSDHVPCSSESQPRTGLQSSHRIGLDRQSELRAADDRVDARVGDAVEQVRGVEPPVERDSAAQQKRPRHAAVQRKLRRAGDRVTPRIAPSTGRRRGVRRGVRVIA